MSRESDTTKPNWVRDGTIAGCGKDIEIDLRNRTGSIWITIKASDRSAEKLAPKLLAALNRMKP